MKLLTYLQVREDGVELFGFKDADELGAFKLLITVSGVGPKAALSILSLFTYDKLYGAICAEDTKAIARASGIGAKTAARVVLELKDKVSKLVPQKVSADKLSPAQVVTAGGNTDEAVSALMALGYTNSEAVRALSSLDGALSVEELIKQGLRNLSRR
jgi:Holliday junction DNA helicase RuvA